LTHVTWMRGKPDFGPEELKELGVAFENCSAAIPETKSQVFRARLALRLINWAALGTLDSTQLYIKALESHRAVQRL
jgi:hypothetical protein